MEQKLEIQPTGDRILKRFKIAINTLLKKKEKSMCHKQSIALTNITSTKITDSH